MYCNRCGAQIPDDSIYCPKCGFRQETVSAGSTSQGQTAQATVQQQPNVLASADVTELKCPGCGAPLKPQIGEMIITCEYCGASISLANEGWKNIESNTMLPLKFTDENQVMMLIKNHMDHGILRHHLEEKSKNEGVVLSLVPYWIVPASARTKYTAVDTGAEMGKVAGTAVLAGLLGGALGGGRGVFGGGYGGGMMGGMLMGGMMMGGMGGGGGSLRSYTLDKNYNYPVVAVKGLSEYQPRNYAFQLTDRVPFDIAKVPKGIKVLNGDIGEDSARNDAKTNIDQLQSALAHATHHSIRNISTEVDVSQPELLHVPIWFAKFDDKGKKIALVLDGHSGAFINSIGLD